MIKKYSAIKQWQKIAALQHSRSDSCTFWAIQQQHNKIHLLWTCVSGQIFDQCDLKRKKKQLSGYSLPCCGTKIIGHSADQCFTVFLSWAMPSPCYFAARLFFFLPSNGQKPQRKIKEVLHPSSVASIHDSVKKMRRALWSSIPTGRVKKVPNFTLMSQGCLKEGRLASVSTVFVLCTLGWNVPFYHASVLKWKHADKRAILPFFDTFLSHWTNALMNEGITGECKASSENNKASDHHWINSCNKSPLLGNEVSLSPFSLLPVFKWQTSQTKDRQPKFQLTLAHKTFRISAAKRVGKKSQSGLWNFEKKKKNC